MGKGVNRGKAFEQSFKADWMRAFPNTFLLRLQDSQSGYYGTSSNPCDFLAFNNSKLFMIECKSIHGNTLPFSNIKQYDKLISYSGKVGIYPGVILWWVDLDKIAWVPIESIKQMKLDKKKSVHINMLQDGLYNLIEIPSRKKRVFLESDYSVLAEVDNGIK